MAMKKEIEGSAAKDRLDAITKTIEILGYFKQSNIGWASLLTNPQMANGLDEEALKDIYEKFRKNAIERIENDIKCIDRYMINLVPRDLDADGWT